MEEDLFERLEDADFDSGEELKGESAVEHGVFRTEQFLDREQRQLR